MRIENVLFQFVFDLQYAKIVLLHPSNIKLEKKLHERNTQHLFNDI